VITALVISGLPTDRFTYLGFLPSRAGSRRRRLRSVAHEPATMVFLEAPHRLREALEDIGLVLGDRRLAVCRELTKLHEEVFRGTVGQAIARFAEPRGEFTLVVEGGRQDRPALAGDIEGRLRDMRLSGAKAKEAIAALAGETGLSKKELYRAWLRLG